MFFSSRGYFNPPPDGSSRRDRLASEGWQNCASCHFDGLTDGVVWSFGNGPRKSLAMNGTFNPRNRVHQKILNNSPARDEPEDFDLNIRNVSGPGPRNGQLDPDHGLIIPEAPALTDIADFVVKANANRNQVTVTLPGKSTSPCRPGTRCANGCGSRSARPTRRSIRPDRRRRAQHKIDAGRALFAAQGCQVCHGGDQWTISRKDFVSPPATTEIATETAGRQSAAWWFASATGWCHAGRGAVPVPLRRDIGSFNLGVAGAGNPIGNDIGGVELANSVLSNGVAQRQLLAIGADHNGDGRGKGYNVPMKLGYPQLAAVPAQRRLRNVALRGRRPQPPHRQRRRSRCHRHRSGQARGARDIRRVDRRQDRTVPVAIRAATQSVHCAARCRAIRPTGPPFGRRTISAAGSVSTRQASGCAA